MNWYKNGILFIFLLRSNKVVHPDIKLPPEIPVVVHIANTFWNDLTRIVCIVKKCKW